MTLRAWAMGAAIGTAALVCAGAVRAQEENRQGERILTVRGSVLNAVTSEPVARALVHLQGLNAAVFTDDRGQFELSIDANSDPATQGLTPDLGGRPVEVRKPGFIQDDRLPSTVPNSSANEPADLTIRILPEAKIVGHIDVPGSEGDVRIQCQLYRKEMNEGRESWQPHRTFINWVDGEFRFYGLRPGTYKLITHEQMDRDLPAPRGEQLYGYPPMYYPNTTDFSLASPIVVKAGETARVNFAVARKEYFPVRIGVENMPAGRGLDLSVYPMEHPGPGWSLGYNPREGAIEGILPAGHYTVEANTSGEDEMTGIANLSVPGKTPEAATLTLFPDATIRVRVREEFQSAPSNFNEQETVSDRLQPGTGRFANVNVNLIPLDELNPPPRGASSRMSPGSEGPLLIIPDVRPGQYQVEVNAGSGYAASVQSGGRDLSRQALVVGLGGDAPPIEVVLRDNGAQLEGTLEQGTAAGKSADSVAGTPNTGIVYLLPMGEGGRPRNLPAWGGQFRIEQLPPGVYLVLAFDQPRQDLPSAPGEAMQRLIGKGQVIRVESGQHLTLRVKVLGSEAE